MTAGEQIARAVGNNMIEDAPIVEFGYLIRPNINCKTLEFPRLRHFCGFPDGEKIEIVPACGKFPLQKNKIGETEWPSVALISQIRVCECSLVTNRR